MNKYYKYEIDIVMCNVVCILLFIFFLFIFYRQIFIMVNYSIIFIVMLLFLWLFLHEIIHGISYYLSGVKKENITFGICLEKGVFYCLAKQSMSKKKILISLLAPCIAIGIITLVIGLIFNFPLLSMLSIFNICGSAGDILMFIYFVSIKDDFIYTEIDDPTSFIIILNNNINKDKRIGVKLIESGNYPNNYSIQTGEHKTFIISKKSYYILAIMLILMSILYFIK